MMDNKVLNLQTMEDDQDVELLASTLSIGNCKKLSSISIAVC